ncbi:MAG: S9 family peptidase [Alphaproteobacteria bacterium]|nr:S9 family peptidase [Alphaproteobacteria bacterium]
MTIDARPTLAQPDDDPYVWLEEIDGTRATAWADAESALTMSRYGSATFAADRDTLTAILDRPDNVPYPARRGDRLFNLWKDARNPRGLWRTTDLASFRTEKPDWDILLDLDSLAAKEGEDWIWKGSITLPDDHDRALIALSRGGGDAVVIREFDLGARDFVQSGFHLPESKHSVAWLDRDTVLLSSPYGGEGMATKSGYARTVRLWTRGADPLVAPVIFETKLENMSVWAGPDRDARTKRIVFADKTGFFDTVRWIGDRSGPKRKIETPSDAWVSWHRGWFVIKPRTPWTVGGETHAPDTLLGIGFDAFLDGDRRFTRLFEPEPRRSLQGFFWSGETLVLSILDNLRPVFEVLTPSAGWSRTCIADMPEIGVASVWSFDVEEHQSNGDLLAAIQTPTRPASLFLVKQGGAPEILKRAPETFNAAGLVVSRHEAESVDGTRIPYVQVGPAGETGDAPVHMTGYGGFNISLLPHYNSAIGKLWLERGGTSVTANIRGGGEFGTAWHKAGMREGKRLSHDDFAAIAADLVRRGVTRPERIAAEGGSNGGILISNMLTRYPERFGALFCTIPLIDMRRYSKLLAGASWMAEYGDPDKPEDWTFLGPMSAYHTAEPVKPYPPILIATTRRDDRVHPGHARKMTAKLKTMGYRNVWFYEPAAGGHGYGKDNKERAAFTALGYAFLRGAVGWIS